MIVAITIVYVVLKGIWVSAIGIARVLRDIAWVQSCSSIRSAFIVAEKLRNLTIAQCVVRKCTIRNAKLIIDCFYSNY